MAEITAGEMSAERPADASPRGLGSPGAAPSAARGRGWLAPERLAKLRQKQENSFTPIFLHRPLAILLLIPAADVGWITPNRITTLSVALRLLAAALLWPAAAGGLTETTAALWAAVALWHVGCVLDAADGALARYRGKGTYFGRYYDKISDRVLTLLLVATLAMRAFSSTQRVELVFLAMAYVAMMSAVSVAKWIELGLRAERGAAQAEDPGEREAPRRTPGQWVLYGLASLRHVFLVTEMDLPLWGSIAVLLGREDLLMLYLGAVVAPWMLLPLIRRGWAIHRMDHP